MSLDSDALLYHKRQPAGKVDVRPSKPCSTDQELSLAYSPGVAAPCKEIAKDKSKVYDYTARGNLVAVVSNGTAVLGLGDIGPEASKPVMEGKGNLFKQFAGINVFDIELNCKDPDQVIAAVRALEPTFGGINLEDIKAPECFYIESELKKIMNIPVFHDDQHGTAIISAAALVNACMISKKDIAKIKLVINGAGAAAVACGRLFVSMGVKLSNIIMCDSQGVVYVGREKGMNPYKAEFANKTDARTLADALKGADAFVGLSVAGAVTPDMVKSMNDKPIIFAMANPDPEITPDDVKKVRSDAIIATGRSDYPNQVNNVLGFPSIFRGALDVRATQINEEMKLAAVHALAKLAREDVPEKVSLAYGGKDFHFGPDYIIPKPFDPRVLMWVAPAVAKAAIDSKVAQLPIDNMDAYRDRLEALQGSKVGFVRSIINRVKQKNEVSKNPPRIIFPEGESTTVLRAVNRIIDEGFAIPILIGNPDTIKKIAAKNSLDHIGQAKVINHLEASETRDKYTRFLYDKRARRGVMMREAQKLLHDSNYYAAVAVEVGDADGMITGSNVKYRDAVRPILQVIGPGRRKTAAGLNFVLIKDKLLFLADTAVMVNPTAQQVANTAIYTSRVAEYFEIKPKIAMLSYTNFTSHDESPAKMAEAARIVMEQHPEYVVDGEMQADTAVNPRIVDSIFPFCHIKDGANILVFPNLDAGNIAYKLLQQLGGGEVIGPFLIGVNKPAHVVQRTGVVDDIFNTAAITALQCQAFAEEFNKKS
ncbi:MAG: NADP-dependent malic enzyme [Bdellovibrionaceae bacterium]|nr:NADP-dependent malic enzyme [Pseudobdellovibrionaceae bacterium]